MGLTSVSPAPPTWSANTAYAPNALVVPNPNNGHYYQAQGGAAHTSGATQPAWPINGTVTDGSVTWLDKGQVTLSPAPAQWTANVAYAVGAQVTPNPTNGHYYQALAAGATGVLPPAFKTDGSSFNETYNVTVIDVGPIMPTGAKVRAWTAGTPYFLGDVLQNPSSGHYYVVTQPGLSGAVKPSFASNAPPSVIPAPPTIADGTIKWQDLGTTLPASVSVGVPSADQTVNLLTYTFPQSHALSYFNLASGVVVSSIKNRTFVNQGPANSWATISSGLTVDPILAVTAYAFGPMDAERPWRKRDLVPGLTFGVSLSNPTTNFYFGGSSELFIRNLQLVYGLALNRVMALDAASLQLSATTAATHQVFAKGGFVGLSFNITGFIQSLIP
jgi:hypothetical protein